MRRTEIARLLLNVVVVQERGARYVLIMLDEKQKKVGVIAASAGKSFRSIALVYKIKKIFIIFIIWEDIIQIFKLLTLIQRGVCAEKYTKLAQSKTLRVLRQRKVKKTSNIKAWLMKRNKKKYRYAFVPFVESSEKYILRTMSTFKFFFFKFWTDQYICLRAGDSA